VGGGFGGEIVSFIAGEAFETLDAPVKRVGSDGCFIPAASGLASRAVPSLEEIMRASREIVAY
jgi:pyruvate/2-oxoglutarate/acetoin dehydrogenase E1 component